MNYFLSLKTKIQTINSDIVGAVSAFLCIIHCAIVPVLMGIHSTYYASSTLTSSMEEGHLHTDASNWVTFLDTSHWHIADYFFILITLIAVFFATRKSKIHWIKIGLWSSAVIFIASILLEETVIGVEYLAYLASASLIVFHLLNQRLTKLIQIREVQAKELNTEKDGFEGASPKIHNQQPNRMSCAC